jgi:hypothetical protein
MDTVICSFQLTVYLQPNIFVGIVELQIYVCSVFTGNTLQDLSRLRETADNTESYI